MRFEPVEAEPCRQPSAIFPEPRYKLVRRRHLGHLKRVGADDVNLDRVTFLEPERLDDGAGQADREAVAPFRDLHRLLRQEMIYVHLTYITTGVAAIEVPPVCEGGGCKQQ